MAAAGACLRIKMLCSMKGCALEFGLFIAGAEAGGPKGAVALRTRALSLREEFSRYEPRKRVLAARVECAAHAAVYKFAP